MSIELLSARKDGMSQPERRIESLMPGNIELDSRDNIDLLQFAVDLSTQFNFYNFDNQVSGDWSKFFDSHITIGTALVARMNMKEYSKMFEWRRQSMYSAETREELAEHFKQLFEITFTVVARVITNIDEIKQLYTHRSSLNELDELSSACLVIISKLSFRNRQAQQLLGSSVKVTGLRLDKAPWSQTDDKNIMAGEGSTREKAFRILFYCNKHFSELITIVNRLSGFAAYNLKNHPLLQQQYPPHLALFITFLHIYDHLRVQLNQLTKKHLDFYYRNMLGIQHHAGYPDKVHVIFEPDLNAWQVQIPAGEELLAEIHGIDEPVKYRILENVVVTKARVQALQTLFISEHPVFSGEARHPILKNAQLFKKTYSYLNEDAFLKEKELVRSWALFGEDQTELADNQRTMEDATVGLLLASPLLYLTSGKRNILLKFYFESATYKLFEDYISAFSISAKKDKEAVCHEILANAFNIDFTAAEGWTTIERYTVIADNVAACIEVNMELSAVDKSFSLYNPDIHGEDYGLTLPVIRLLINNYNSHNAWSFLRYLIIERINITAEVTDSRDVKMQNSIGQLSPLNPFQPFGPQPFIGSYFDIKNTNIFNRYTREVTVRFEWLELPKQPGGFEAWFEAYDAGITNESFKVAISALSEGINKPVTSEQQQVQLFRTLKGNVSGLCDTTTIRDIDIKKLEFLNKPLLEKEELQQDTFFRNGAMRFELISPPEAFGHRLFPKIFPEIALHNSRRFVKKMPLPELPYIPKVKQVSINYTLEHDEVFKESRETSDSGGVQLIHQHPFGYKKIYPGSSQRSLLPRFEYPANVYIGISQLQPENELTLFFQLEESNFHHTLHEMEPVTWSCLCDDAWVELSKKNVVADSTQYFINTGIVKLNIPGNISTNHTTFPSGLSWIRASVQNQANIKSRVIAIYVQGAVAERIEVEKDKIAASGFYLPAGSIKGFARKVRGIKKVLQLFPSFNGKPAENDEQYYTRVSERLAHKQRPVAKKDIEQFVLQQFPAISMVKCIGATDDHLPIYPGVNLQVIVIPKETKDGVFHSAQPKADLATLFAIKNFLTRFISTFIKIEVGNPVYEKVKIVAKVRFIHHPFSGGEQVNEYGGFYLKKLLDDIRAFFCPWLYQPGSEIKIGTKIYLSGIITFIKNLPYVEEVTGFSAIHFFNEKDSITGELRAAIVDSATDPVEFIQGSVPEAVLIPSDHHLITVLEEWEYAEPVGKGVNDFLVGEELLVTERKRIPPDTTRSHSDSLADPEEYFNVTIQHNTL